MYGLLIENLASFIRTLWGEGKWDSVRKHAGIDAPSFSIHHVYSETLISRLARSATQILDVEERQFFEAMGVFFVEFVGHYGYDQMLTVLGRQLRDFFNGLDNLHEYLKFSYPKMRAPSFYCDCETATGLHLHYRSKRRGFVWYTLGQIRQVSKHFYGQDIQIELLSEELEGEAMHYIYQLTFDNHAFVEYEYLRMEMKKESQLPIRASILFELFPFCIVFSTQMVIRYTGHALLTILKHLVGQSMNEAFELHRPLISFSFQTILDRSNNTFELRTISPIKEDTLAVPIMDDETAEEIHLKLRGQMLFMEDWNMILFLASPVMPNLESLVGAGIFINDLSLHDCSRDLVLAGTQQSVELKLALDQEQLKSKKLEESMRKLDEEMNRTDELLYQMIPKQVADRLRRGEKSVATCEVFEDVSILFSDVVTFTDICSKITPIQVVGMLNHMYSLFDQLTERNAVYKVETIGDSYMVVSGAPIKESNHAEKIADMAMDMMDACKAIRNPTKEDAHLELRIGCHSGMVVAGVVGTKMPRYCLFGDSVNIASKMESSGKANEIQISEATKKSLPKSYEVELREVENRKEGEIVTYWLRGREARVALTKYHPGLDWAEPGQTQAQRIYSKESDKQIRVPSAEPSEPAKSRDEIVSQILKPKASLSASTAEGEELRRKLSVAVSQPPKPQISPPTILEPPMDAMRRASISGLERPPTRAGGSQTALNKIGEDVYGSCRRSLSRSPTPSGASADGKTSEDSRWGKMDLNRVTTADKRDEGNGDSTSSSGNAEGNQDQDEKESFLVKFKMKGRQGSDGGLKRTIDGIAVGIRRLSKNEALKKRIKENRFAVLTADVLEDMGCVTFADKQKQVISQICNIL